MEREAIAVPRSIPEFPYSMILPISTLPDPIGIV
jgi:hypothetical protein